MPESLCFIEKYCGQNINNFKKIKNTSNKTLCMYAFILDFY